MNVEVYINKVAFKISELSNQKSEIMRAAAILSDAIMNDRLLHIYGSEEVSSSLIASHFFKAGKPMNLNPMFDPSLDPAHGSYRNTMCMEVPGLAPCILDYYEYVEEGDPIILIGSDPIFIGFSEALEWAKAKGLIVIAVTCSPAQGAEVSLKTGSESYADGTYIALASTILELMFDKVKESVPERFIWKGSRFVDLQHDKDRIKEVLFRVKHL
ncbi:MAG: SIS domain-containing protein [Clostridia bacterium]|nr:SIS domain-containing protein [Clostridia bacterium]